MADKLFPIQPERGAEPHPLLIPWSVAELAYSVYAGMYGRGQPLARLAERGGFGPGEMDSFLPGWRAMCSEIETLKTLLRRVVGNEDTRCLIDHNGFCQEHDYAAPCPIPAAHALVGGGFEYVPSVV